MLNSVYGMSVTNPLRNEHNFNGEWFTHELTDPERAEELQDYNEKNNRFLFYPWGVFVTAYARRNLFTGIKECGPDYIYSDTDSLKLKNVEDHENYFKAYDLIVEDKLKDACEYHDIDFDRVQPKNSAGDRKRIGVWDYEGKYDSFKTLGAKRYMYEEYDENGDPTALKVDGDKYPVTLTVSGINKYEAIPHLFKKHDNNIGRIFENFEAGLEIPASKSGKLIHAYIDHEVQGEFVDYLGTRSEYQEYNSVHLEPAGYYLSLARLYINYLKGVKERVL